MYVCEYAKATDEKAWRMRRAMLYLRARNPKRYQIRAGLGVIAFLDGKELIGLIERIQS